MKGRTHRLYFTALLAGLGWLLAGRVTAQTFATLHSFSTPHTNSSGVYTNIEGMSPFTECILSGSTLYGATGEGGGSGDGTVFRVNADGSGFTNLHIFNYFDGHYPAGRLVLSGNTLFGTAYAGGSSSNGVVFKLNTDGTDFTNLHSFTPLSGPFYNHGINNDGALPNAGLVLSGNTLYGTTEYGGNKGRGAVFAMNTNGIGFTNLHSFTGSSDGESPIADLVLSENTLYGTAEYGGSSGKGTVFRVNTDGSGFTNLYSFTALVSNTNSDGALPNAGLLLSGNFLYGTAFYGGSLGRGTVFTLQKDGTGFITLHSFNFTNGGYPVAGLILSSNALYGTTRLGGTSTRGTIYVINTDGNGYSNLYNFNALSGPVPATNSGGVEPFARLVLSGGTFYGAAVSGGLGGGTIFKLTMWTPSTNTISGSLELQAFAGSICPVRFIASAVSGGVTNYLQTNDVTLGFTNGVAAYSLPVPTNTTHISAKTAWHLRKRQAVNFTNGVAAVDFTSANNLRAGDLALGSPGIGNTDNAVSSSDYLLLLGYYLQPVNGDSNIARADLNGDGVVSSSDYLLLLGNYLTSGDAP